MARSRTAPLTLRADHDADALCLVAFGDVDLEGSRILAVALRDAIARHPYVVLDLSGLDFLDTNGIQVLVEADLQARVDGRRFEILRGPRPVERVVRLCRMSQHLPFAD